MLATLRVLYFANTPPSRHRASVHRRTTSALFVLFFRRHKKGGQFKMQTADCRPEVKCRRKRPRRGKIETLICPFFTEKVGFKALELRFLSMGIRVNH